MWDFQVTMQCSLSMNILRKILGVPGSDFMKDKVKTLPEDIGHL